jgi:hypothetical protein
MLGSASEVFFASTRVECLPIATVDGEPVGGGTFPLTTALRTAFVALVREETALRRRGATT